MTNSRSKDFEEVFKKINETPLVRELQGKFRNNVEVSGFILRKPKFIMTKKGKPRESACFILYQPKFSSQYVKVDSFSCMTFTEDLVEQFKKLDNVIYVNCLGTLRFSRKVNSLYVAVNQITTNGELDIKLAEAYVGKNDD